MKDEANHLTLWHDLKGTADSLAERSGACREPKAEHRPWWRMTGRRSRRFWRRLLHLHSCRRCSMLRRCHRS